MTGNPKRTTYNYFTSSNSGMDAGIWCCEAGAWRIAFADDTDEFFTVLEGIVRLHDEAGIVKEIGPGEAAVIPAGFKGMFEVVEPVRKYYVIVKRTAA